MSSGLWKTCTREVPPHCSAHGGVYRVSPPDLIGRIIVMIDIQFQYPAVLRLRSPRPALYRLCSPRLRSDQVLDFEMLIRISTWTWKSAPRSRLDPESERLRFRPEVLVILPFFKAQHLPAMSISRSLQVTAIANALVAIGHAVRLSTS